MNIQSIYAIIIGSASLFALIYGLINMKGKVKGYFYPFILLGFFGSILSYLYILLLEVTDQNGLVFNLGTFGQISTFLCGSFACRMIEKVDSCEIENKRKYKFISFAVPAVFIVCWLFLLLGNVGFEVMILPTLLLFSAMPCGYFCFKNIITPYPKGSLAQFLKPFFAALLTFCLCTMLLEITWLSDSELFVYTYGSFTCAGKFLSFIFMPIFLERGTTKWMQM